MFILLLLLINADAQSQAVNISNLRKKKIATSSLQQIDSLSIVPGTFSIEKVDTSFYNLNPVTATIFWKQQPTILIIKNTGFDSTINATVVDTSYQQLDSVNVIYRVFPYRLDAVAKRFTYDSIMNNFIAQPSNTIKNKQQTTSGLFNFGTINYNGSFGRALSFGNSQDVVLNSQFNLQLDGLIGDSIEVAAAITDNNIPIQPDGTTQQLNEFDRVWLQFKKKGWQVNLGDIDLRQNENYYLNFYKRVQGVSYSNASKLGRDVANKVTLSGAIAKGKFTRNVFQGQEGNQGPYRLKGANNEFFFIILAGTERVFIDGVLMQRGEDQDYIINYNTAEIAFMPRQMITKDKRIQVEFEYAERSFLNAFTYGSNELTIGSKVKINVAAYSNADSKNSPINQTLDVKQRQFLANVGDSIQSAFYPTASIDTFTTAKILYKRIDTSYAGVRDSIYLFSNNRDSAIYSLGFIEVGQNRGNYVPEFNGANGKVYKWVQPVNNVPQGSFEPASYLVTPKKQQLVTVATTYAISSHTTLQTDLALSNYDVNAFSSKDKGNDKGYATRFNLTNLKTFKGKNDKSLNLTSTAGYEWVDKSFKPLERLRSVEFYRDWGLELNPVQATEHLPMLQVQLNDSADNTISYTVAGYFRSDDYKGLRHTINQQQKIAGWQLKSWLNYTGFTTALNKGYFLRPTVDISKSFSHLKNYTIGGVYSLEHNEVRHQLTDTVSPLSFAFNTISAYIKSDESKNNKWAFNYFTRTDKLPTTTTLEQTDRSQNFNLMTELRANLRHQFRLNVTYRYLDVINPLLTTAKADNSMLGRVEYNINEWKGLVTGTTLYELGAGQEQRRDFSYIEVPAGRGEYAWNDYNADGIPQINEFEVALFRDQAKFIRIFTPTNQFVKANYTQLNYSININPKAISASINNKKFRDFITRFNLQSSLQTGKKQLAQGHLIFNPFKGALNDTTLITLNNVLVNTLSFNRFKQKWGVDVTNTNNYNKALLTYGFESRQLKEWNLKGRWNITRQYTLEIIQRMGSQSLFTPKFANRNYDLQTLSTEPRFTYINGTSYRVQTSYEYRSKVNVPEFGGERSIAHSINAEAKYNAVNNTSLNGKLTYSKIDYTGAANSTISYIMLEGLLPGKNLLWNFDVTKRLSNNLELSFQYEGRKPADTRTIHIGRASLRAIL